MQFIQLLTPRAGRLPLARTIVFLTSAAVLGACVDATTAPALKAPSRAAADAVAPPPEEFTTSVDLSIVQATVDPGDPVYGTRVGFAVRCSANEVFDVVVDLEQEQKEGRTRTLVRGSTTYGSINCRDAVANYVLPIYPYSGVFQVGRATVRARIAKYEPWVEPADVTRRVRVTAE